MLFPTLDFALFFAVVFPLNWALNRHNFGRKLVLVAASYIFYAAWDWHFVFLLLASGLGNYLFGLWIGWARGRRHRRVALVLAVAANLSMLGFFKYWDFLTLELARATAVLGHPLAVGSTGIALPVAISFLTFHGLSYLIDIARGRLVPSRSPLDVMLYVGFFPHLVAGPIVRAADFIGQLRHASDPGTIDLGRSGFLILGGLVKKVLIASYLSTKFVDPLWVDPSLANPLDLLIGLYAYGLVIYCDFSAYTDIAIGIANLLGYRFPQNFDQPYRAVTLREFWRRWHISLSSWLRDYLYISLGGSRGSTLFTLRNLMITMTLGGLWHGAGLQFIAWGFLHGLGLAVERLTGAEEGPKSRVWRALRWLITLHVVLLLWVPFRSGDLGVAIAYLRTMLSFNLAAAPLAVTPFVLALLALGALTHLVPRPAYERVADLFGRLPLAAVAVVAVLVVWALVLTAPDGVPPFIYFQF